MPIGNRKYKVSASKKKVVTKQAKVIKGKKIK